MPQQIDIVANLLMKVDGAEAGINKLKSSLSKLKMPEGLENSFKKSFSNLDSIFARYRSQVEKGFNTKGDITAFSKTSKELDAELNRISKHFTELTGKQIDFKVNSQALIDAQNKLNQLVEAREKLSTGTLQMKIDTGGKMGTADIETLLKKFEELAGTSTKAGQGASKALISLRSGDSTAAIAEVNQLINGYKNLGKAKKEAFEGQVGSNVVSIFEQILKAVKQLDTEFETADGKIKQVQTDLANTRSKQIEDAGNAASRAAEAFEKEHGAVSRANGALLEHASATQRAADEVKQLQQSTQYFFSLRNMINLLKQGIREAVQTVKELDAAMTETAVVTDYSVSDMWSMLPQYTAQANELGATIQDMYESTTLYYQQGLQTEQAMGIAAETMKMARIAGLEAKDATDMMTAALRGFNMELSNTSAQRINDVYSNLAAKTASDTNELGTAMQRTASIAYSAGMSFEGTAAFLAQAIETTREPAENIGTAMKTIVARFQEMKENPLEITEVDGEEVSYNKVDTALQSIGVSLKDTNGQFRELDKVFLDISQRWNGLTQTQQRYIATVAAGSRQQSRFIAMMNNYDRTIELMGYANDSEGASAEQFGKTLESLQAKINEFQNAWKQFLMGIMNDVWTKRLVVGGTLVLNTINKIINALSFNGQLGLLKSALSVFTAFTALKGAGRLANRAVGGLGGLIDPTSTGKAGWRNGAIGSGKNLAQAQAISNPIVQAIHQLQAAITGKQASSTGDNGIANYKASLREFRKESKKEGATVSGAFGTLKGLSGQQMQYLSRSNAGRMSQIQRSLADTDLGKTISAQLMTAINRGQISGNQIASLNKANLGRILGTEEAQKYSKDIQNDKNITALKNIYSQALNGSIEKALRATEIDAGQNVSSTNIAQIRKQIEANQKNGVDALTGLQNQYIKGENGKITNNPLYNKDFINNLKSLTTAEREAYLGALKLGDIPIKPPTGFERFQQGVSQLGGSAITAGQGLSALGSTLNSMGFEAAGTAVSTFGNALTNLGMIATGLPKLLSMIASPAGLAVTAIAGVILLANKRVKDAKEAAEKTIKDYEDAVDKADKKISTLSSAQDVFNQLGRGVDEHNNNIKLSTEEYDQYLATAQEVADIAPELIRGYDAQGRAIIDTGDALDALIKKQEEYKEEAAKTFTSNSSINDIVGGIQVSDAFKKIDKNSSVYDPNEGIYKTIPQQAQKLEQALSKAGITNFDKISKDLFGHEINLLEPSNEDLHLISAHYDDIYKLLETENSELTDKQKENLQNVLSEIGTEWEDAETEVRPLAQAMGQYLSSEGIDTIGLGLGEEFTESFNKGLDSLAMTAALEGWEAPQIKDAAREYAEGFKKMTQDGSEYATIMEQVTAKQEEFNKSIGEEGAIENYQGAIEKYAIQLEQLADKYDDGTVAGELFANSLREQAGAIQNYATESAITLGEALNTLSDEFESARGAQERFQEATKDGDYYTAAEGYKGIIDTILDDKNLAGDGSLTFWAGADELLGQEFVDKSSYSEVVSQVKKIQDCFAEGSDGVLAFNDLLVENADKLKGLGYVADGNDWHFDLQNEDLAEYAEVLGMSEEALAALIDKSRQWVPMDLGDPKKIRQALEASETSMLGTSSKGKSLLYTSEDSFREEARRQHIRGDDYTKTKADAKAQGVRFLTVENLTAKNQKDGGTYANKVLENIGLKDADKTLDNAVAAFSKMGFDLEDTKEILTADGIKLADGQATKEQVEEAYNKHAYTMENPTVAGIASDTGIIASAATAMLTSMGILTKDAEQKIDESTEETYVDNLLNKVKDKDFADSDSRNTARQEVQQQIDDYEATLNLLQQGRQKIADAGGDTSEIDARIEQLTTARNQLQDGLDVEADSWNAKIEKITSAFQNFNTLAANAGDQEFLNANAVETTSLLTTDSSNFVTQLQQFAQQGDLAEQTVINLVKAYSELNGVDLSGLLMTLGYTTQETLDIKNGLNEPFHITTKLEGDDLEQYIDDIDGLTQGEKRLLLKSEVLGAPKVESFLNIINNEFGDGSAETKQVLIEATAELAGGNAESAHEILQEAFGDDTEEVEARLGIICDGSIANKSEVQTALKAEIETLPLEADVKADINTNFVEPNFAPKGGSIDITTAVDEAGIESARANAESGADMPINPDVSKFNTAVANAQKPGSKKITITPNFAGTWSHTLTINKEERKRGQNYSIPASHSLSFGSAANGLNISKKKKSTSSNMTALVGEEGYEVGYIPSEGRSVIFGANGPEMTSFPSDTVIYPHKQSKEILRRGKGNHQSLGSFGGGKDSISSGGLRSSVAGSTTIVNNYYQSATGKDNKGGKHNTDKKDKTPKAVKQVNWWWDKIAKQLDKVTKASEQYSKALDKQFKDIRATIGEVNNVNEDYIKVLTKQQTLAKQEEKRARIALGLDEASGKKEKKNKKIDQSIVVGIKKGNKSKDKAFNATKFISYDKSTGSYYTDYKKVKKKIKGRENEEAVYNAVESWLKDYTGKLEDSIDSQTEAQDKLAEYRKQIDDTFFGWENELTQILRISSEIERVEAKISQHQAEQDRTEFYMENLDLSGGSVGTNGQLNSLWTDYSQQLNDISKLNEKEIEYKNALIAANKDELKAAAELTDSLVSYEDIDGTVHQESESAMYERIKDIAENGSGTGWDELSTQEKQIFARGELFQRGLVNYDAENGYSLDEKNLNEYLKAIKNGEIQGELGELLKSQFDILHEKSLENINLQTEAYELETENLKLEQQRNDKAKELAEQLYGWKNSLTEILELTNKIEQTEKRTLLLKSSQDYYTAKQNAGLGEGYEVKPEEILSTTVGQVLSTITQIEDRTNLLSQQRQDLQDYISGSDLQKEIDRISELPQDDIAKARLDELEKEQQIRKKAQKYVTATTNADGTVSVTYDSAQLEKDNGKEFDADTAKRIEEYAQDLVTKNNEIFDSMSANLSDVSELYSALTDLKQVYSDRAKELREAYGAYQQKQIDATKSLYTAIDNSFKELISQVRTDLQQRRQAEDNAKTEQDISKKQQRLAALRANTSGGNQVAIAQLQKEIADAQQSYGRTLEDQTIDKISQQGDLAAKQREQQLQLMQTQRDIAAKTGQDAAAINQWLQDPTKYENNIKAVLQSEAGWAAMSEAEAAVFNTSLDTKLSELNTLPGKISILETGIKTLDGAIKNTEEDIKKSTQTAIDNSNLQTLEDFNKKLVENNPNITTGLDGKMDSVSTYLIDIANQLNAAIDARKNAEPTEQVKPDTSTGSSSGTQSTSSTTPTPPPKDPYEGFKKSGYTEEDLKKYGVSISRFAGMSAGQVTAAMQKLEQEWKNKQNMQLLKDGYNNFLTEVGQPNAKTTLNKTNLKEQIERGKKLQKSEVQILQDLADTKKLGWADVLKAYIKYKGKRQAAQVIKPYFGSNLTKNREKGWLKAFGMPFQLSPYATGGLNTSTGPAWLDGTPSKPELVLNAQDTKNFIALKDVLARAMSSMSHVENSYGGNATYEININVDHLNNDYDVDKVVAKVKKEITKGANYRNVTQVRNFK